MAINKRIISILVSLFIFWPIMAKSQEWESGYFKADEVGSLSTCYAMIVYADAHFIMRVHGQEMEIDFIFSRGDFALPLDELMGEVKFVFKGDRFSLLAFSNDESDIETTDVLYLFPQEKDYANITQAMRFAEKFGLVFPGGDGYTVDLNGSNRAIKEAFECYASRETGAHEGVNPFQGRGSKHNPFAD